MTSRQFINSILFPTLLFAVANLLQPRSAGAQDLDNVTITACLTNPNGAMVPGAAIEVPWTSFLDYWEAFRVQAASRQTLMVAMAVNRDDSRNYQNNSLLFRKVR